MLYGQILEESKKLLRQYRDIPSLDKSRDMLVSRYGVDTFNAIRQQFARLWLAGNGIVVEQATSPASASQDKKAQGKKKKKFKSAGLKELEAKLKGGKARLTRYEKKQSARAAAIMSPKPGTKFEHPYADKVKDESITTHKSIHTLRG